jgi:hypothetical protein
VARRRQRTAVEAWGCESEGESSRVEWSGVACSEGGAHPFIGVGGGPERWWPGGNSWCYAV